MVALRFFICRQGLPCVIALALFVHFDKYDKNFTKILNQQYKFRLTLFILVVK